MASEGIGYALGLALLGAACGFAVGVWAALPWLALAVFCLFFFRDPDREIPAGRVCVSPADGRVVHLSELPPDRVRISIFLSIFDVHVNRMPVSGRVRSVRYSRGGFRMAHREQASVANEQNSLVIEEQEGGSTVEVRQIAGLIARRIVCRKREGDLVAKGERFGLIKFGSRVDILLGPEWEVTVGPGDRVAGGRSILAHRKDGRS